MTTTEPVERIDLTAASDSLTYAEILTPAGIIRVNVGLVNWRTNQPVVCVEVEPNTTHHPKTAAEDWDVDGRSVSLGARFDVTLTKRQDSLTTTHQGRPVDARNNIPEGSD